MPDLLTDTSDPLISAYAAVGDPAALARAGLFVAEGRLIVERLLEHGGFRVHSVLVTPAAASALAEILARRPDIAVLVRDPAVVEAVTGFDFHRGCLALAQRPPSAMRVVDLAHASRILAVEGVGNPDNIGGLFRTAFAFGVDAVLLDATAADPLYRKALRTSMGASLRVPYLRVDDWGGTLGELRALGFRSVALTPHPEAAPLDAATIHADKRLVLIAGTEGAGLAAATLANADILLRIPIDPRADSLNVVVAAAIALHALAPR